MKRELTVIVLALLLTTACLWQIQGVPTISLAVDEGPADTSKPAEIPSTGLQVPLPFRPYDPAAQSNVAGSNSEIQTQEITQGQKVPVFMLQTSGMRFAITALFFIAAPLTLIMIVYSAIRLIVMAESEEEGSKVKRTLIFSAIGLLIMSLAYALVQNVIKVF